MVARRLALLHRPLLLLLAACVASPLPNGPSQAFVQLFEWSWDDVAQECEDWLGPKGFKAVQVSPANEHVAGAGWEARYEPVSYNLTSRSGGATQFGDMVRRCRTAGVDVYADLVFNHQARGSGVGVAGSTFGKRSFPLFGPEDFYHLPYNSTLNCAVNNYNDVHNVHFCDYNLKPDLCTNCRTVQEKISAYITQLVNMGVAGVRIDAAKNMPNGDIGNIMNMVNRPDVYRYQEVPFGGAVRPEWYFQNGAVTEHRYSGALAPKLSGRSAFREDLANPGDDLIPSLYAVVFLDNHETQRGQNGMAQLTYKAGRLYILANVFMLAHPYGYPRIMSSYHFDNPSQGPPSTPVHGPDGELRCGCGQPWVCEHRHTAIANMVQWRAVAGDSPITSTYTEGRGLAFCRGTAACVALNRGSTPWRAQLRLTLPPGTYCDVLHVRHGGCRPVEVLVGGVTNMEVPPFEAVAVHVRARSSDDLLPLSNVRIGMCGVTKVAPPTTTLTSTTTTTTQELALTSAAPRWASPALAHAAALLLLLLLRR